MLFIDLDRFKQINDTLGHNVGDQLLRLAAARMKGRIRARDTLARVGGDEFVVLLVGLVDGHEAERIASDLVRQMSMPFVLSPGGEVRIGASVGVSYVTEQVNDAELLGPASRCGPVRGKERRPQHRTRFRSAGRRRGGAWELCR